MEREKTRCRSGKARALLIHFVGDPVRGRRLQAIARHQGWCFYLPLAAGRPTANTKRNPPDIVILDGFPDAPGARAAFYRWRDIQGPRFLVLNETPHARKFLHVNGLSFIGMIARDPGPEAFTRAIHELAPSNRKLTSRLRGKTGPGTGPLDPRWLNPCPLRNPTCC